MKTIFFCLFISIVSFTNAQTNLTVFNNGDQSFHIILNGIKQNQFPQKNVCVTNVTNGGHALKVVFANGASADIDKKLFLDEASDIRMSIEFKKGKGKLRIISYEPTKGSASSGVIFRPTDSAIYSDAPVVQSQNQTNSSVNQNQSTTQITSNQVVPQNTQTATITTQNTIPNNQSQTITTQNPQAGINTNTANSTTTTTTVTTSGNTTIPANTSINLDGGVNINVNGMTGANSNSSTVNSSSQTTTTTITSSSQTSSNSTVPNASTSTSLNTNTTIPTNAQVNSTSQTTTTSGNSNTSNPNQGIVTVNRGTAKINCSKTLGNIDVYVKDLKALSFESDQVEAIEKDFASTCLTSAQAYKIVEVLTFESNRLDIAKFLSDRMTNRDKAGDLLALFTFDSNKVEYKDYIR
ncbi:MAG: DUF4476 domain-containing protein [Crocinitomicaceae bacterium]|nr:DUF4476 domain-containing protein [Crocinitomicaceae bacterium]